MFLGGTKRDQAEFGRNYPLPSVEEISMAQTQRFSTERASNEPATIDTLKAELSHLASTVQQLATDQFGTAAGAVQEKAAGTVNDLEVAIRRNPTQAAAIAAGAGFLLGLILRR